jgi:hypothetical protein
LLLQRHAEALGQRAKVDKAYIIQSLTLCFMSALCRTSLLQRHVEALGERAKVDKAYIMLLL